MCCFPLLAAVWPLWGITMMGQCCPPLWDTRVCKDHGEAWVQISVDIHGEAAGDLSGCSVAVSGDGTRQRGPTYSEGVRGTMHGQGRREFQASTAPRRPADTPYALRLACGSYLAVRSPAFCFVAVAHDYLSLATGHLLHTAVSRGGMLVHPCACDCQRRGALTIGD